MKKFNLKALITACALTSCSFAVMAQQATLPLQKDQILNTNIVKPVALQEGQQLNNVWFSVETNRVKGTSSYHLSNCALSANLSLESGQLQVVTNQLRCISDVGDIFTDKQLNASFVDAKDACKQTSGRCSQAIFEPGNNYNFKVNQPSNLTAEFNAMREVNKNRLID